MQTTNRQEKVRKWKDIIGKKQMFAYSDNMFGLYNFAFKGQKCILVLLCYGKGGMFMEDIQKVYKEALESFTARVKKDSHVIAAVLMGSLSYDQVWEKSDIDMLLIVEEDKKNKGGFTLVENGINFSVSIYSRNKFKKEFESALQGNFFHSYNSKGTLLFTKDPTIEELYNSIEGVGSRDAELGALFNAALMMNNFNKAQKWLYVKKDTLYSFLWLTGITWNLASIEILLNRQIPTREVIHQALKLNPEFFNDIYTDTILGEKSFERLDRKLKLIDSYLLERHRVIFAPVLDYLAREKEVRTISEIHAHLGEKVRAYVGDCCEWLAEKGIIEKMSQPVKLTLKSRVDMDEAAYYYESIDI